MCMLYHPCEGYNTFIITLGLGDALYPEQGWYNEFIFCLEPNCACATDVARCVVTAVVAG